MQVVVITGSTRGIGFGLADSFLALDCAVVVNGRAADSVDRAIAALGNRHDPARIFGQPGDITDFEQVQTLWDTAHRHFGRIDIWINNAGIGQPPMPLVNLPPEHVRAVIETNMLGTIFGAQVALAGLMAQGGGSLYLMEGLGSDGRQVKGLSVYGSTKRGLRYFTRSLVAETQGSPVLVGSLSPGMVLTDMLTAHYDKNSPEWARARRIFNILADRVETVAPWLARQILANRKHGARIAWLTRGKILSRFLLAPFRRRDLFSESA